MRKQNYTCRKQNEVSKFVHVVCDLRNMAMCRRNLQLKLLKAVLEENGVLNELYGVIIMRKKSNCQNENIGFGFITL